MTLSRPLPAVLIRAPTAADEREFLALRRESRDWLEPWEPVAPPGYDLFGADGFERWLSSASTDTRKRFLICAAEASTVAARGAIVGQVSLGEIIRGPLQQAFMGYWVGKKFAGHGYMTAGLALALDAAFRTMKLHRIEANIQPQNATSIALVKRLGFRKEGFSPRYLEIQGKWADHERWAMLAEEWLARK